MNNNSKRDWIYDRVLKRAATPGPLNVEMGTMGGWSVMDGGDISERR